MDFASAFGSYAGENYDYDPHNKINWTLGPNISVTPSTIDFGDVNIGESAQAEFYIENSGGATLTGSILTPVGFSILNNGDVLTDAGNRSTTTYSVDAGTTETFYVVFEPTVVQMYSGNMNITHNALGAYHTVVVQGECIDPPPAEISVYPESLTFGDLEVGESLTLQLYISNSGGRNLIGEITSPAGFELTEVSPRDNFTNIANGYLPLNRNSISFIVSPGAMLEFDVTFEPLAPQDYTADIVITHNAAGGDELVPCLGRGIEAVFTISSYTITKIINTGQSGYETLTFGNGGNVDLDYIAYIDYNAGVTTILQEDFESSFPPTDWSLQSIDGNGNWIHSSSISYSGSKSAQASIMDANDARLITPFFTVTEDCILKYWIRATEDLIWYENSLGEFWVEVSTDGTNWTTIDSYSQEVLNTDFVPKAVALGDYTGQNVKIAFRVYENYTGRGVNIDYVKITGDTNPAFSWLSLNNEMNLSGSIAVGAPDVDVQVGFNSAGLADGNYFAFIRTISNDSTTPERNLQVSMDVGTYGLAISTSLLDFGNVNVGSASTLQFVMENTGTLEISGIITPPTGYTIMEYFSPPEDTGGRSNREELYYILFPNNSMTFDVTFEPQMMVNYDGDISVGHNMGGDDEIISVTGSGIAAEIVVLPASFQQEQQPDVITSQNLIIDNSGNADLTYTASIMCYSDNRDVLVSTGFEDATFPPSGWNATIVSGTGNWQQDIMNPNTGIYCALADWMMEDARLISPVFTAANDTQLSYYIRTDDGAMYGGNFGVEVSTDGSNWSFIDQIDISTLTASYSQEVLSLSAYDGQNIQIAFRMYNSSGTADQVFIDDVEIAGPPAPTDQWLSLDGETSVSGSIAGSADADVISVGFNSADLPEGYYMADIIINSNDPFTPQVTILTELIVGYPQIVVSPDSVGFGSIEVGQQFTSCFSIENTGTIALSGNITTPEGFTVSDQSYRDNINKRNGRDNRNTLNYEISAGFSEQFDLTFAPTYTGEYNENVIITHNTTGDDELIIAAGYGASSPALSTNAVTNITNNTATCGGEITDNCGSTVTVRGVCWSTSSNPTTADDHTTDGTGIGTFVSSMNSLEHGTLYYVRAYAENFYGISYGNQVTFSTTLPTINISVTTLPNFGEVTVNSASVEQSYSVSGENLESSINISAPIGFEISTTTGADNIILTEVDKIKLPKNNRDFGTNITLSPVNGSVSTTTIFVRFTPSNAVAYSDTIMHFSTNSAVGFVNVTGTGVGFPLVTTDLISNIGSVSASCGGEVTDGGNSTVTACGVCWSTSANPTLADFYTVDGAGLGEFSSSLTGLTSNTLYYVRSYATNSNVTGYGNEVTFTTATPSIYVSISTLTDFGSIPVNTFSSEQSYYVIGSNLIADLIINAPAGFELSLHDEENDNSETGGFSAQITLSPVDGSIQLTMIYVRFSPLVADTYSDNITHESSGTVNRNVAVSGTGISIAAITTNAISNITETTATGGGNVTANGGSSVTARGVCWSISANPTTADDYTFDGSGTGAFVSSLTTLDPGTLYYVRAYATNSVGIAYGNEVSFTAVGNPHITVSTNSLQDFGAIPINTNSIEQSYTVSGSNLTGDVTINAPAGFQISLTSEEDSPGSRDFSSEIILSQSGGIVSETTIFVRFQPTIAEDYTGIISHESNGGITRNISVGGSGISYAVVATAAISEITQITATGGGEVVSDGNSTIIAYGVCWSVLADPTILDDFTVNGSGTGTFTSTLTNLYPETHYFVRAYATNSFGTSYGAEEEFDTISDVPPAAPTNLTIEISGGNVSLNWDAVTGADSYKVYSSDDPTIVFENWTLEQENITGTTWSEVIPNNKKFYCVTAVNDGGITDGFTK